MKSVKFTEPAGTNPIDREKVVGQPHARIDGPLKVTGQATYAFEYAQRRQVAYGYVVTAGIGRGRILSVDTRAAEAAPGVLLALHHEVAPPQGESDTAAPSMQGPYPQLVDDVVDHYGQAVAIVVARTPEEARHAANLVKVNYRREKAAYVLAKVAKKGVPHRSTRDSVVGTFDGAFRRAPVKVDVTYTTPDQSPSPMEPHASQASWDGDELTLHTSHQVVHWVRKGLAATLKIPEEKVRIVTPYVGGGFGSKLVFYADAVLSALAARELGRPVKVALTRPQMYNHTTHRPATIQRVRLGADRAGRLSAIGHDSFSGDLPGGEPEAAADQTKALYAAPNQLIRTRLSELHLPPGGSMRAPGEAVGMLALEGAMDELAERLGMDPVELRVVNDTPFDPVKGPERPYSSRKLVRALRVGAERFGWDARNPVPGQLRDGEWLVGMGVASAFRKNFVQPSGATVRLEKGGRLTVETQMTDIGTGSYTILGQVAAEMLGVELDRVTVKLGDSDFPQASGSGGSFGANSASTGVFYACEDLRRQVAEAAGYDPAKTDFRDGEVWEGNRCTLLAKVAAKHRLSATANATWGDLTKQYLQASFGAHFAEVGVHVRTGEVRVRRLLSVVAAGRILNPVTARSQCLGGMTMGIGAALMEELVVDGTHGLFINHDLAEYHVPVNADIPELDVVFLEELDEKSSPLKAKGVGELGICGVGAAVANAAYNASGVRVRDFPVTLDKILAGWEAQGWPLG